MPSVLRPIQAYAMLIGFAALLAGAPLRGENPSPPKNEQPNSSAANKPADPNDAKARAKKALEEAENYELLTLFADTVDQIERNYVKDVNRRELMEAAIRGMITKLDQHSTYIPPEDVERFKGDVESEFGGIGIQVTMEEGQLKVISPLPGTPAYKAGILAGDRILTISEKSTKGLSLDECIKLMKGPIGSKVALTISSKFQKESRSLEVERALVKIETVQGDSRTNDKWNYLYNPELKIGYVRITSFSRHTFDELQRALKQLVNQKMKGLVLDLRFNPGGLLTSAIEVSDLFLDEGRIVSTAGRNVPERAWDARKEGTVAPFPMAILVNRYSASASEIVAACLQDHNRAIIIGERTYGKGSVQNIVELEEGKSALKLTTAGYKRPSGKNIHKFEGAADSDDWGVTPNTGFDLKFSDEEMHDYLTYRRWKDQLQHEPENDPAAENKEEKDIPHEFSDRQLDKGLAWLKEQIAKPADAAKSAAPAPPAANKDAPK